MVSKNYKSYLNLDQNIKFIKRFVSQNMLFCRGMERVLEEWRVGWVLSWGIFYRHSNRFVIIWSGWGRRILKFVEKIIKLKEGWFFLFSFFNNFAISENLGYIPNNPEVFNNVEYLSNTNGIRPVFLIGDEAENLTQKLIELSPSKFRLVEIENSKDIINLHNLQKSGCLESNKINQKSLLSSSSSFSPAIISLLLNKRPEVFSNLSLLSKLHNHAKSAHIPALLPIVILLNSIELEDNNTNNSIENSSGNNKLNSNIGCWATIDGVKMSNVAAYSKFLWIENLVLKCCVCIGFIKLALCYNWIRRKISRFRHSQSNY